MIQTELTRSVTSSTWNVACTTERRLRRATVASREWSTHRASLRCSTPSVTMLTAVRTIQEAVEERHRLKSAVGAHFVR